VSHTCHAAGCNVAVPAKMFMCKTHWYKLRKPMRDAIWREYRPGQEKDKNPSPRYMAVQRRAVAELAEKEGGFGDLPAKYAEASEDFRAESIASGLGDPLAGLA
jgi:hypothetical protein